MFLKSAFFNLNFGSFFFYLKLVFFFIAIEEAQLKGKKAGNVVLPIGNRFVSYHFPIVSIFFFFFSHCFMLLVGSRFEHTWISLCIRQFEARCDSLYV